MIDSDAVRQFEQLLEMRTATGAFGMPGPASPSWKYSPSIAQRGVPVQSADSSLLGVSFHITPAASTSMRGPERFFYDRAAYTGTHRFGGPDMKPVFFAPDGTPEAKIPAAQDFGSPASTRTRSFTEDSCSSPRRRITSSCYSAQTSPGKNETKGQLRGPERFFYDTSSYTGTHRFGGPDLKGGRCTIDDGRKAFKPRPRAGSSLDTTRSPSSARESLSLPSPGANSSLNDSIGDALETSFTCPRCNGELSASSGTPRSPISQIKVRGPERFLYAPERFSYDRHWHQ